MCPHCGHAVTAVREEDTVNGISVPVVRRSWILQMLADGIEKALRASKTAEALRMLKRAAEELEDRVAEGEAEPAALVRVAELALHTAVAANDPQWAVWSVDLHRRAVKVPAASTVGLFEATVQLPGVITALQRLLETIETAGPCDELDAPQLVRIEELANAPQDATSETSEPAREMPTRLPPAPATRPRSGR